MRSLPHLTSWTRTPGTTIRSVGELMFSGNWVLLKLSDVLRSMLRNRELLKWLWPKWVWHLMRTEWITLYTLFVLARQNFMKHIFSESTGL